MMCSVSFRNTGVPAGARVSTSVFIFFAGEIIIFIIPLHKQIVPKRLIDKFIASLVLSKIDEFNFSKFPEKIAKENDIIIKIGQTIFNIFYHQNNFILKLTFYYNLIDQNFYL